MGIGRIDGRPLAIGGEDTHTRAAPVSGRPPKGGRAGSSKTSLGIPHPARQSDRGRRHGQYAKRKGYTVVPGYGQDGCERSGELLGIVPVVSAVMGTTAGGPSMRAILSHWSDHGERPRPDFRRRPARWSSALLATSLTKEALGAPKSRSTPPAHRQHGEDEADCLTQIRRFLSYMPAMSGSCRPTDGERRSGRPLRRRARRHRAARVAPGLRHEEAGQDDRRPESPVRNPAELRPLLVTALARMNGRWSASSQQPRCRRDHGHKGGAQGRAFRRAVRHVQHPARVLRDIPGLMVGANPSTPSCARRARALHQLSGRRAGVHRERAASATAWPAAASSTAAAQFQDRLASATGFAAWRAASGRLPARDRPMRPTRRRASRRSKPS